MSRRIASLTLDTLADLPTRCRSCVHWELDAAAEAKALEAGDTAFEKEAWLSGTLLEWGSCGKVSYVDGGPAGFVLYAPPSHVPRSAAFPTSPVSADAVLLMTAHVESEHTGQGIARTLIQAVVKDVMRRGFRAIEAFGDTTGAPGQCLLPAELLLAVGFKTVRPHPRYPRLRLELKSVASWRDDVEVALDRLLGSLTTEHVLRPSVGVR